MMDGLGRCLAVTMVTFGISAAMAADNAVERYRITELNLTSDRDYPNPFADVKVTATFTCGDTRISRLAFWDGGRCWKIRFAAPTPGTWTWSSTCSDETNGGLNRKNGSIEVIPYRSQNPNYLHGPIRISENRRYFVRADGTPFFWLGDTHWQMADWERLSENNAPDAKGRSQFVQLVEDRVAKGFTVYQNYFAGHLAHWWRDDHYGCIDPKRFQTVMDPMMDLLADRGLVIAQGIGLYITSVKMPRESLVRLAEYVAARYGAHPIVWFTGQEVNLPPGEGMARTDLRAWQAAAAAFAHSNGYGHPVGGHMYVGRPTVWGKEPWHDWFPLQGGHTNMGPRKMKDYRFYWNYTPRKPFLETEAMYENIICGPRPATARDVREVAWKSLLSGSYGYTYGAAAIWLFKWDKADERGHKYNPGTWWYEGMNLPGSTQMTHLKEFFTEFDWWDLQPRFADADWCRLHDEEATVLATASNRLYVLYAYGENGDLGQLRNLQRNWAYGAWWFNPRTGERQLIGDSITTADGDWTLPQRPSNDDWVLLLRENPVNGKEERPNKADTGEGK